jgi:hypothetical protein
MTAKALSIPTIHMNGTPKQALVDAHIEAVYAIRLARKSLSECAPNGRDYYPQGGQALIDAMAAHQKRCLALDEIASQLEEMAVAIDEGGYKKED